MIGSLCHEDHRNWAPAFAGEGLMATFRLVPHSDHVGEVEVEILSDGGHFLLTFIVKRKTQLLIPQRLTRSRADNLWKTTCFEMFLAQSGTDAYFEFNFSPSTQWAAYRFDSYRTRMSDLSLTVPPHIKRGDDGEIYVIEVECDLSDLPRTQLRMGLSAVIEETDGTKSYWALAHAPGPPDFHNPDCFIAALPAPDTA